MANEFKSDVGTPVSKKDAMEWIEKYDRENRVDKAVDTKSVFYGRNALLRLLSEEGSAGITFFLALKYNADVGKDTVQLVLVPTTADGKLIWPEDIVHVQDPAAPIGAYNFGVPCPPYCPQ